MSANPAGGESRAARRLRVQAIVDEWCRPFGGVDVLSPAERTLALTAAELSLRWPRRHADQTRQANTISKLLAQAGLATIRDRTPQIHAEAATTTAATNAANGGNHDIAAIAQTMREADPKGTANKSVMQLYARWLAQQLVESRSADVLR